MPHEILFSLLEEIQTQKKWTDENRKKGNLKKKVREIGWVMLIFI